MSRLVDNETERFQQRMPDAGKAETFDPIYNHVTHWLDRILHLVDVVMEDEGVATETRRRVVRGILYGSPDPIDAETRMAQHEQLRQIARWAQPSLIVPADLAATLGGGQR